MSAASVILENVVAFEVARALVDKFGGDSVQEMKARWELFHTLVRTALIVSLQPEASGLQPTRMYAVKFSTRRRLCRMIFCLACVLPMLLLSTAIVVLNAPVYRAAQTRAWQTRLSAQFGLEVRVAEVMPHGNSRWLARGLECLDPESHEWLARVRSADMAKTTRGWLVTLGQPQLNARRLGRLVTLLHEHILLRADELAAPVQLAAASVELSDESNSESVLDVRSAMDGSPEGAELLLEFRSPSVAADERVRVRFVRNRQLDPPATGWELHTDSTGMPCSVALSWLPALSQLGDACVFQGSVWCEQRPAGWEVELRGVFRQVDLERLVTRQFPHKLSGSAVLTMSRCQVHAGRVTEAQGRLSCEGGVISQSLLDASERSLGLQQQPRRRCRTPAVPAPGIGFFTECRGPGPCRTGATEYNAAGRQPRPVAFPARQCTSFAPESGALAGTASRHAGSGHARNGRDRPDTATTRVVRGTGRRPTRQLLATALPPPLSIITPPSRGSTTGVRGPGPTR